MDMQKGNHDWFEGNPDTMAEPDKNKIMGAEIDQVLDSNGISRKGISLKLDETGKLVLAPGIRNFPRAVFKMVQYVYKKGAQVAAGAKNTARVAAAGSTMGTSAGAELF